MTSVPRHLTQSNHDDWDWPLAPSDQQHMDRFALLRPIRYEFNTQIDRELLEGCQGKALSINISSGGMLLLMKQAPALQQVMKVHVPTPISLAEIPTLAEVRWTRPLPLGSPEMIYLVGVKFIFLGITE